MNTPDDIPTVQRSRRQMLKAAGGASLATLVAGCAGGEGSDDESPTEAGETDGEETATPGGGSSAVTGGTLRIALRADPEMIHPHKVPGTGITLVENMSNALYRAEPDGEILPDLAREMPDVSDDGLTWVVPIREGVKFHPPYDREVTAEDVVDNWRRIMDADYGAYGRGYYVDTLVGEDIDPETTIQQTGEYEVTFNLQQVYAPFLIKQARLSAFGWFSIIPLEALDEHGEDFGTLQTGAWATGPFMYNADESSPGSEYVMEKNPNYFAEDEDGNQLPYLDRLEWVIAPEDSVRKTQLQAGDIHVDTSVSPTDVESMQNDDNLNVESTQSTSQLRMWVNLHTYEPTANKQVRKAMMYAMNRDTIVQTKFNNFATVAYGPIPSFHWAYDDDAVHKYEPDLERAQTILNEEGYGDGFELKNNPTNSPTYVDTATILQQQFAQVGIDMQIEPTSKSATYEPFYAEVPDSDWHSAIENFIWAYSADDYTGSEFHSDAAFNYAHYSNETADELMMEARRTVDRDKRKELYSDVQEILTDDVPMCFLVWEDAIYGSRKSVKNLRVWAADYPFFEDVWLEE